MIVFEPNETIAQRLSNPNGKAYQIGLQALDGAMGLFNPEHPYRVYKFVDRDAYCFQNTGLHSPTLDSVLLDRLTRINSALNLGTIRYATTFDLTSKKNQLNFKTKLRSFPTLRLAFQFIAE